MRRGFKAEAERIASETREELGLTCVERLDPKKLAKHLEIPVLTMSELAAQNGAREFVPFFSVAEPDVFSAVTIVVGRRRLIVHNEFQHPHRQASNLAHELSHIILEHPPTKLVESNGQRAWNSEVEQEAHWCAGCLLVPREGAFRLAQLGGNVESISGHFGLSTKLCAWRLQQTGIFEQLRRRHRLYH